VTLANPFSFIITTMTRVWMKSKRSCNIKMQILPKIKNISASKGYKISILVIHQKVFKIEELARRY